MLTQHPPNQTKNMEGSCRPWEGTDLTAYHSLQAPFPCSAEPLPRQETQPSLVVTVPHRALVDLAEGDQLTPRSLPLHCCRTSDATSWSWRDCCCCAGDWGPCPGQPCCWAAPQSPLPAWSRLSSGLGAPSCSLLPVQLPRSPAPLRTAFPPAHEAEGSGRTSWMAAGIGQRGK